MFNDNNTFDLLRIMCDATLAIADGNWGDTKVEDYVRERMPNCQHVEAYRDILHRVIRTRAKAEAQPQSQPQSQPQPANRQDTAFRLFQERNKDEISRMRSEIHREISLCNENIYNLLLDIKAAEIFSMSEKYNELQKELSANNATKQELEKFDNLLVRLLNLL